ncbi:MAG: M20/M25/M40 family metallo-hydrolase [Pirellulaceae bacterium]
MLVALLLSTTLVGAALIRDGACAEKEAAKSESAAAAEKRLNNDVTKLASDAWEGRGIGTEGIDKAAQFIADQFAEMGLETRLFDGAPFQNFKVTTEAEMGPPEKNHLTLMGPGEKDSEKLKLGENFTPLSLGGSGAFDVPLVFVGYGITSKEKDLEYDEYAGLDVKEKAVIILRKEPQQNNPHSVFNGTDNTPHAFFTRKIANAYEHGAAAVLLVNDVQELVNQEKAGKAAFDKAVEDLDKAIDALRDAKDAGPEDLAKLRDEIAQKAELTKELAAKLNERDFDPLVPFSGAGGANGRKTLPVFFVSRDVVDPLIKQALGEDLKTLEAKIDKTLEPVSAPLDGWTAKGEADVIRKQSDVKNVVAVLDGEGPLADETVIVGAHYDHLGYGGQGSLAPWTKDIHNGADDNASGTAALLEVARRITSSGKKPARRIVFIAFTGEERGLLGSARYVREPRFPLSNTVAMVNMDMVGRLVDDKLIVYGTGTADTFDKLIDDLNADYGFKITKHPSGFGPSDHSSFYAKKIPVFHVFTGTHKDYHRPSDDADKINVPGMLRVSEFVTDIVETIAGAEKRPEYREVKREAVAQRGGDRPYLGTIPDFSQEVEGYALMGVAEGGPASRGGLKSGDVIVKFGESKIGSLEDIDSALRKYKAGDKVPVVVKRDGKDVTLTVTLDPPR